jgi:hypothetical protein
MGIWPSRVILQHRVSRKLYVLILNRVVADTLFTASILWDVIVEEER